MYRSLMLYRYRQWIILGIIVLFVVLPLVSAAAQPVNTFDSAPANTFDNRDPANTFGNAGFTLTNPLAHGSTLCDLLNAIFNVTLTLGIPVAVVFLVLAGLRFVMALGNQKKLLSAKKNIYYTLLGIVLFVGAWFLGQIIFHTLAQLGGPTFNSCFSSG